MLLSSYIYIVNRHVLHVNYILILSMIIVFFVTTCPPKMLCLVLNIHSWCDLGGM